MANYTCPLIAQENDSRLLLSSYNTSVGTNVQIACKEFAQRYKGPPNITCYENINWSNDGVRTVVPTDYKCEWTGVLNTYEKIVLGVAAGAASFFIICLVSIVCLGCLSIRNAKSRKARRDSNYKNLDNSSYGQRERDREFKEPRDVIRKSGPYSNRIQNDHYSGVYATRIDPDLSIRSPQSRPPSDRQSGMYENRIVRQEPPYGNDRRRRDNADYSDYDSYMGRKEQKYDNRAYVNSADRLLHPVTNRENYKWNGQIPRPQIGQPHREDRHAF